MSTQDCIEILYVYRMVGKDRSEKWCLSTCFPGRDILHLVPGSCDIARDDNLVTIFLAVPCDEFGIVDQDGLCQYERIADEEFREAFPQARLVQADASMARWQGADHFKL